MRKSRLHGLKVCHFDKLMIRACPLTFQSFFSLCLGVGARRMEVNEEHKVFSAKTILFRAREESTSQRRAMSLGPAAMYDTALVDDDDVTEVEGRGRRRSSFLFQPDHGQENYNGFLQEIDDSPTPSRDPSTARGSRTADVNSRQNRQVMTTDNPPTYQEATPPPSRSGSVDRPALSPAHSSRYLEYLSTVHENPALALQESRDHLLADLDLSRRSQSASTSLYLNVYLSKRTDSSNAGVPQLPASSSSSSIRSFSHSRRPSIEDVPEDLVISRSNNQRVPSVSQPRSPSLSGTPNDSAEAVRSPSESRGRKSGRFSFTSVGSALLDAVRSTSSRSRDAGERAGTSKGITSATEEPGSFRGRRMERTVAPDAPPSRERTREEPAIFAGMGSDLVGGESSKEFKKGTYKYASMQTYHIFLSLPLTLIYQSHSPSLDMPHLLWMQTTDPSHGCLRRQLTVLARSRRSWPLLTLSSLCLALQRKILTIRTMSLSNVTGTISCSIFWPYQGKASISAERFL